VLRFIFRQIDALASWGRSENPAAPMGAHPCLDGAAPAFAVAAGVLSRHTVTFVDYQALAKAQPVTFAVTTVTDP